MSLNDLIEKRAKLERKFARTKEIDIAGNRKNKPYNRMQKAQFRSQPWGGAQHGIFPTK